MQKRCDNCFQDYDTKYSICPHCGFQAGDQAKKEFYLTPGTILNDRYHIGKGLGDGGFGITYLAWDDRYGVVVAIKEYFPSGLARRDHDGQTVQMVSFGNAQELRKNRKIFLDQLDRFLEEAKNLAQFRSHPNIVNVHDSFQANETAYIVMEYLDGVRLDDYLEEQGGTLPLEKTLEIAKMMCTALKDVHEKKLYHRDIALDNIMILKDGTAKLFDFGAVHKKDDNMKDVAKHGFAPIEQYSSQYEEGPWTDIYAFGAVLYMLLTGELPEVSTNRMKQVEEKQPDPVVPLREKNPEVSEALSNVIMKALAIQSAFRFTSITEMEKGLFYGKKFQAPEAERKRRLRRRWATLVGSIVLAGAGLAFFANQFFSQYITSTDLVVWYCKDENSTLDAAKQQALETVVKDFEQLYPQVHVSLQSVSSEAYAETVQQALANGQDAPDLFESTALDAESCKNLEKLTSLIDDSVASECYFLDQYTQYFPDGKKIPLGFHVPVLYINQTLLQEQEIPLQPYVTSISKHAISVKDNRGKTSTYSDYQKITVSASQEAAFSAAFPEAVYDTVQTDAAFLDRKVAFYYADSSLYLPAISTMPGQIVAVSMPQEAFSGTIPCTFGYAWSVYENNGAKKKAAERLLSYMLSEAAQETMLVKNQYNVIPLQKKILENYCSVYENIYADVKESIAYDTFLEVE